MYEYRKLSLEERAALVQERRARGYPPHQPPHPVRDQPYYLLTATCYLHANRMPTPERRQQLLDALFEAFVTAGIEINAWVVLPNHYHLLAHVHNFAMLGRLYRRVHGPTARLWNLEDGLTGSVWYSFADRAIRSDRHYCTTLNYIHYNPVKHRWARSPYAWAESSVHWYLATMGREWLRELWAQYPLRDYGRGWDDAEGS